LKIRTYKIILFICVFISLIVFFFTCLYD